MRVSASKAGLLAQCAYAFREGTPWLEERGRAAVMGDDFHQRIAGTVDAQVPTVLKPITTKWLRERLDHAQAWIAENQVAGWRAEVAYGYDPQTGEGRILGYNIGREYEKHGKKPYEIAGSADIAVVSGETVIVYDWKTGRAVTDAVWPQMEWLCLMAARATGAWDAKAVVLHATDYGVVESVRAFTDVDLWGVAERMRVDVGAIEDAWPTPGLHCDACYCPARNACDLYQLSKKENAA